MLQSAARQLAVSDKATVYLARHLFETRQKLVSSYSMTGVLNIEEKAQFDVLLQSYQDRMGRRQIQIVEHEELFEVLFNKEMLDQKVGLL